MATGVQILLIICATGVALALIGCKYGNKK